MSSRMLNIYSESVGWGPWWERGGGGATYILYGDLKRGNNYLLVEFKESSKFFHIIIFLKEILRGMPLIPMSRVELM